MNTKKTKKAKSTKTKEIKEIPKDTPVFVLVGVPSYIKNLPHNQGL